MNTELQLRFKAFRLYIRATLDFESVGHVGDGLCYLTVLALAPLYCRDEQCQRCNILHFPKHSSTRISFSTCRLDSEMYTNLEMCCDGYLLIEKINAGLDGVGHVNNGKFAAAALSLAPLCFCTNSDIAAMYVQQSVRRADCLPWEGTLALL